MHRPRARLRGAVATAALALVASACSGVAEDDAPGGTSSPTGPTSSAPTEASAEPSTETSDAGSPSAETEGAAPRSGREIERRPPPAVSLPAYFTEQRDYTGRGLRLGAVREQTAGYTSYDVSYRSDGLRISGVLNVPSGRGPFPAVVLAHGYIDPDVYVRGQGMTRERGYLASRGYVALHVDYRAHAESGGTEQQAERNVRLGYVADVLNAASALRRSGDVAVDPDRVALFGRSMGGGVTLRALSAAPGVFDAGVAWASVSSREDDNFERWTRPGRPEVARYLIDRHGAPGTERGRDFWRRVSARPYFDRMSDPLLLVHGRYDDTCPPRWATTTQQALDEAGANSRLVWYDDGHAFGPAFNAAMDRTIGFLDARMA